MPKNSKSLKRIAVEALVVVLVGIFVYSTIGVAINFVSVAIYSPAPTTFRNTVGRDYSFNLDIQNNAPLSLPYINPFYSVAVSISGDTNAYAYYSSTGGTLRNFTESNVNLGRVDSGTSSPLTIFVNTGSGQNFNVSMTVWYYFVISFKARNALYSFENQGNDNYKITQLS